MPDIILPSNYFDEYPDIFDDYTLKRNMIDDYRNSAGLKWTS